MRGGEEGGGAMIVNERLRPVFRVSGTAVLERAGRVSRFIDNTEFNLVFRASSNSTETWFPVRPGIQTTSRGQYNSMTMDPDALDKWSEARSYELSRATQMAFYGDTPRQDGWIYSPPIDGLTFVPNSPSRNGYLYASVPLFPSTSPRGSPPLRGGRGPRGEGGIRTSPR